MVPFGQRNGQSHGCHKVSEYLVVVWEDAISFPKGIIFRNVTRSHMFIVCSFHSTSLHHTDLQTHVAIVVDVALQ